MSFQLFKHYVLIKTLLLLQHRHFQKLNVLVVTSATKMLQGYVKNIDAVVIAVGAVVSTVA
jgi:hypothetical protein